MITAERIDNWLKQPHELKEVATEALQQLAANYPYFTIAQLLQLVKGNDQEAEAFVRCFHDINPVLLHDIRLRSHAHTATEEIIAAEAAVYTEIETEPAVEEIVVEETETFAEAEEAIITPAANEQDELEDLMTPASAGDYFMQQGIKISDEMPTSEELAPQTEDTEEDKEQSLLVTMSFSEWLNFINVKNQKQREEEAEQRALKTMWQKQKLAAAIEEENEEIPEMVFEMAVNSIAAEDGLVSESLADVYARQGKKEKALEMYRKLILQNPEKKVYFASKIDNLQKES